MSLMADEEIDYAAIRAATIARNKALLESLDLGDYKDPDAPAKSKPAAENNKKKSKSAPAARKTRGSGDTAIDENEIKREPKRARLNVDFSQEREGSMTRRSSRNVRRVSYANDGAMLGGGRERAAAVDSDDDDGSDFDSAAGVDDSDDDAMEEDDDEAEGRGKKRRRTSSGALRRQGGTSKANGSGRAIPGPSKSSTTMPATRSRPRTHVSTTATGGPSTSRSGPNLSNVPPPIHIHQPSYVDYLLSEPSEYSRQDVASALRWANHWANKDFEDIMNVATMWTAFSNHPDGSAHTPTFWSELHHANKTFFSAISQ